VKLARSFAAEVLHHKLEGLGLVWQQADFPQSFKCAEFVVRRAVGTDGVSRFLNQSDIQSDFSLLVRFLGKPSTRCGRGIQETAEVLPMHPN
jgi:hypothetical protein